ASGRLGLRPLWSWAQNPFLQTIFGSVSFVGLGSVLYLRPTVPWKYRADIPLMILVVIAVVGVEYVLLSVLRRFKDPATPKPDQAKPGPGGTEPDSSTGVATDDTKVGTVVPPEPPPDVEAENLRLIHGLE